MNVPDLRNVDFEGYERRARELQLQAIESAIDHALAWMSALRRRQHGPGITSTSHAAA